MEKILETLKEHLSEADLKEFKSSFEKLIESKVTEQLQEKEKVLECAAERMIKEETEKEVEKISEELKEKFDNELKEIETTVVESMTMCIKEALKETVSDDMLHKIALAEMYEPIIAGTQQLFESHLVKLSPSSTKQIERLQEQVKDLDQKLNEAIEQNFEHEKDKEILKRSILIESAKIDLTEKQAEQLDLICENVDFENLEKNIEKYVKHIQESSIVNPRQYLSEKDIKSIQKRRYSGRVEAMGDLDESKNVKAENDKKVSKQKRLIWKD